MATWPASLPAPLVDGYGIEPVDQTVGTDMEVGTQRVRRRSFAQVDTVRFAVNLSDAQMSLFRVWFYSADGADGGAGWFTISLWIGRGGSSPIECRFKGTPKWDMTGNHRWLVTGQLEARPYAAQWWDYFAAAEVPSLDLNFAEGSYSYFDGMRTQAPSDPFADFITFTRTTTATYFGADGLLKTAAINEPRIEYDPITGECKGLLIEESRANLLAYSEAFDNAVWGKTRASVNVNVLTAPDGTVTSDKLIEDATASSSHLVAQNANITANTQYTISVFAKAGQRSKLRVYPSSSASWSSPRAVDFDIANGIVIDGAGEIKDIGNGWYRCSIPATAGAVNAVGGIGIQLLDNSGSPSYTGDGTSGLYVWGAQLEAGSFPTSYIKTESTAVTRGADNASVTGANFSSWYRQDEGSILLRQAWPSVASTDANGGVSFSDGTNANVIQIRRSGTGATPQCIVTKNSISQAATYAGNVSKDTVFGVATAYKVNDFRFALNGGQTGFSTDASGELPVVDRIFLHGSSGGVGTRHISRIAYWPKRLSNAKLQELSA